MQSLLFNQLVNLGCDPEGKLKVSKKGKKTNNVLNFA